MTLNDWIVSGGKYMSRATSPDLTDEVKHNAAILCGKVNAALDEMGYTGSRTISSGFRPSTVNLVTPGAAPKSGHMIGKAVDFADVTGKLWSLCASKPDILRRYGLFLEDRAATPTWCHLDYIDRPDRPSRVFQP